MAIATLRPVLNLKAAVGAGLLAGLVFLMMEMIMVPLFLGGSPWGPPRMIGAMALGAEVLPPPATFDLGVVMVAMMIHFAMSAAYGVVVAVLIARIGAVPALAIGAGLGLALYLVNFYVVPSLGLFEWFAMARNWVSIVAHMAFGLLAALFYEKLAARR